MNKELLKRYFVAGSQDLPTKTLAEYVAHLERVFASGVTVYQFREKGAGLRDGKARLALARRLRTLATQYQVAFFVDDDVELAMAVNADGIHVGQDDMPIRDVIARVPAEMLVGLSVRNVSEMQAAQSIVGLDYVGVGPVADTSSKADAAPTLGIGGVQEVLAANTNQLPTVGIGGITLANLPDIAKTNLDGVAVISLLTQASRPEQVVQQMIEAWGTQR